MKSFKTFLIRATAVSSFLMPCSGAWAYLNTVNSFQEPPNAYVWTNPPKPVAAAPAEKERPPFPLLQDLQKAPEVCPHRCRERCPDPVGLSDCLEECIDQFNLRLRCSGIEE